MKNCLKLILVAGARPNFMKIAPIVSAIKKHNDSINNNDRKAQVARAQGVKHQRAHENADLNKGGNV